MHNFQKAWKNRNLNLKLAFVGRDSYVEAAETYLSAILLYNRRQWVGQCL